MHKAPNHNPLKIAVCVKLLLRVRIRLFFTAQAHYSELVSRYSETLSWNALASLSTLAIAKMTLAIARHVTVSKVV